MRRPIQTPYRVYTNTGTGATRQVISYLRVSTDKQGESGLGIEAQREAVARFIAAEGCGLLSEYVEVGTGKGADALDRRPQLAAAWRDTRVSAAGGVYFPKFPPLVSRCVPEAKGRALGVALLIPL